MSAIAELISRRVAELTFRGRAASLASDPVTATLQKFEEAGPGNERAWLVDTFCRGTHGDVPSAAQACKLGERLDALTSEDVSSLHEGVRSVGSSLKGVLLLKSVAAGEPLEEAVHYAWAMLNVPDEVVYARSTMHAEEGLVQQWSTSCAPSTVETALGEVNPIYAWKLNAGGDVRVRNMNASAALEQKEWLESHGGHAVLHGYRGGVGMEPLGLLNEKLSYATGASYRRVLDETPASALDGVEQQLEAGYDVPIAVQWQDGNRHSMLAMEQAGPAHDRWFQIHDPDTGRTAWIAKQEIEEHRFPALFGDTPASLYVHYEATPL